jgi:ABC-type uncharacterized transport system YnjBCD permease subunit
MHGNNTRNLPIQLSLSQISKNAMFFLLPLMIFLQQNWRREQVRFCLEARGRGWGRRARWPKHVNR